jgi:hypothetical protein
MFGMNLVNMILMAAADKKFTTDEIRGIVQATMLGLGVEFKFVPTDLQVEFREDGSVAVVLSKSLISKLHISN